MSLSSFRSRIRAARHTADGLLVRRLLVVLGVYFVARLVFFVDHRANFADSSVSTVLWSFVRGTRFDVSAIAYSNIPFILLSLVPASLLQRPWYQRLLLTVFLVVNGALTVVMVGDVGYYPFTGTRVTMDVFALSGEATAQADQLFLNFAGLTVIGLTLIASLWAFYPRARPVEGATDAASGARPFSARAVLTGAARVFTVLLLTVLAARGGVQKKPLKPIHAFASGDHEVGVLTLNSAFTLIHSPRQRQLEPVTYFANAAEVDSIVQPQYGYAGTNRDNIVLLMLESYGTEFWGGEDREEPGLTPFLDSLSREGLFFTTAFANGRRSMDALPSILLGVPLYLGTSIAVSNYQANEWRGLGHYLGGAGYHTSMFHGAVKGTMYFDAIASMSGIADFYPLERFPESVQRAGFDGHWGLYDEPALQFAATELSTHPQPWFSTLFTISTHHPYRVPPALVDSLPTGRREVHQSVAYVDLAVRRFFETARQQPWFENTLFIITGDHTPPMRSERYDTPLGRYMVPVLLYHPRRTLPAVDTARVTQHVDLFQTVLDYSGVRPRRIPSFGRSIFAADAGEAVLTTDGVFWLVRRNGVLERMPDGRERALAFERERTGATPGTLSDVERQEMSKRLLAYVQHFTMSMINNSFYREPAQRTSAAASGDN